MMKKKIFRVILFSILFQGFGLSIFEIHAQNYVPKDSIVAQIVKGNIKRSLEMAIQNEKISFSKNGRTSKEYISDLQVLGSCCKKMGKFLKADSVYNEGLKIIEEQKFPYFLEKAIFQYSLSELKYDEGHYIESDSLAKTSQLTFESNKLGPNREYLNGLAIQAKIRTLHGDFEKAIDFFEKVQRENEKNPVLTKSDQINFLTDFSEAYQAQGLFEKAEPKTIVACKMAESEFGKAHPIYASIQMQYGILLKDMGKYEASETCFYNCLKSMETTFGKDHSYVAMTLQNLGALYIDMGLFVKSEQCCLRALDIYKQHPEKFEQALSMLFHTLGIAYDELGNYEKSLESHFTSLTYKEKAFGASSTEYAMTLDALAETYKDLGRYKKSLDLKLKSVRIKEENLGKKHYSYASSLVSLGNLYFEMNRISDAKLTMENSLVAYQEAYGKDHPNYAAAQINMGLIYLLTGESVKGEKVTLDAKQVFNKFLLTETPEMIEINSNLMQNYWMGKNDQKLEEILKELDLNFLSLIKNLFPGLSEFEKGKLIEKYNPHRFAFQSILLSKISKSPHLTEQLLDHQLSFKGVLLSNTMRMKNEIQSSKDTLLIKKFNLLEELKIKISKIILNPDSLKKELLDEYEIQSRKLEKEISQSLYAKPNWINKEKVSWKQIQLKLKKNEAAIELVRIQEFGFKPLVVDSSDVFFKNYSLPGFTDRIFYVAFIIEKSSKFPKIVVIDNGHELEDRWIQAYRNCISHNMPDNFSYNRFWKKINSGLGTTVKRIYFSPDGVYNFINLNTLKNPNTGKYVLDEREIRLVTSTKDILTAGLSNNNPSYALLVGFPDYNAAKEKRAAIYERSRQGVELHYFLNPTRSHAFSELPATKTEVETISRMIQKNGWQVESLVGVRALEESIKEVKNPRVLHIATHGFFQPDTAKGSNPLIHSGLLLTGANKTLSGEKDDKVDDGILTAYEAMNLNLDNTDLVVLSACETGLGEIKNGEGVYGLQRAFKVAGAKSLIMSLWKVNDSATQELMVSFYKNWLSSPSGSKRAAFLKAQKELKAKYPQPYYWGAFVMVGE